MFKYSFCLFLWCFLQSSMAMDPNLLFERQLESTFSCWTDSDCKKNSFCSGNTLEEKGFCVCNKGYIIQKDVTATTADNLYFCYKEAENLGDPCELDIQCQTTFGIRGICIDRRCGCEEGSHFFRSECYKTVKLGGICFEKESCLLKNQRLAPCVNGRCRCEPRYRPYSSPDGEECRPAAALGESCVNNEDCFNEYTNCVGVCRCRIGYVTSTNRTACLRYATLLGDECLEDVQCVDALGEQSECRTGSCGCKSRWQSTDNRHACIPKPVLVGHPCDSDKQCARYEMCVQGLCRCAYGWAQDGHTCTSHAHFTTVTNIFTWFLLILAWHLTS